MEEFCPSCIKQGLRKKMKAIQINLEEAVWMCESETCVWPMDSGVLEYIPRKIGESWSCYWNTYKPNRSAVTPSQSDWESFFTPPYTPKTEVSPAALSDTSSNSSYGVNNLHSEYSKEPVSLLSSTGTLTSNITNEQSMDSIKSSIDNTLLTHNYERLMDITSPSESNQFSLDRLKSCSLESKNSDSEIEVNTIRNPDSSNSPPGSKNLNTKVPLIVSIEKTNLVSVRSKNTDKNSSSHNSVEIEDSVVNPPSIEVKTVKIDGLPPVTLTYKIPPFLQETNNIKKCKEEVKMEAECIVSEKKEPLSKKCIMASKMYKKFSFSDLRKAKSLQKSEAEKAKIANNNDKSLKVKQSLSLKNTEISEPFFKVEKRNFIDQNLPVDTKPLINNSKNSIISELITSSKMNRNLSQDSKDCKDNVINDLDSFLNEFIEENNVNLNESISSNIVDDDWLSSLLV